MSMPQTPQTPRYDLVYVISNYGAAGKIIFAAKKLGAQSATILLGKGTASSPLLKLLDLSDIRKEITLMLLEHSIAVRVMKGISEQYHFEKPNHGITFRIPVTSVCSVTQGTVNVGAQNEEEEPNMYQAVFIIVERGRAEDALEAASQAGARGGTIIQARGSGTSQTSMLFSMEIEPEKEIALIITDKEFSGAIVEAVSHALDIDKPGNGIIFVQDVSGAHGLY